MNANLKEFKKSFEDFKESFENFQINIKEELSLSIGELVKEGRFDDTQVAVDCLKDLMNEIQFNYNFDSIEASLKKFNTKMERITDKNSKSNLSEFYPDQLMQVKQDSSSMITPIEKKQDNQLAIEDIKTKLEEKNFTIIKTNDNQLRVKQKNKNLQLVYIDNDSFNEEHFVDFLEEMNELKNIGFIFEDAKPMKKSQLILDEWVKTKPQHDTRFLSVNFSNLEMLNKEDSFEIVRY